jgi:hypothetical protein
MLDGDRTSPPLVPPHLCPPPLAPPHLCSPSLVPPLPCAHHPWSPTIRWQAALTSSRAAGQGMSSSAATLRCTPTRPDVGHHPWLLPSSSDAHQPWSPILLTQVHWPLDQIWYRAQVLRYVASKGVHELHYVDVRPRSATT